MRLGLAIVAAAVLSSACVSDGRAPARLPEAPAAKIELGPPSPAARNGLVGPGPGRLAAPRVSELPPWTSGRAGLADDTSILLQLGATLTDVRYEEDGGEAIDEALAGFSRSTIRTYGAGLLTAVQLFGDPFHAPICDPPELRVDVDDADGDPWEIALELPQYLAFVGDLEPVMGGLPDACAAGLVASAGDVDAAVDAGACGEDTLHQFFEPGTACRACVEADAGDFAACVDTGACTEEAPQVTWVLEDGQEAWYQLVQGTAWACRPDWLALVYVLAHVPPDGTLPESYDHANWNYYCYPLYDPDTDSMSYTCDAGDGPTTGSTLGEGILGRTLWMEDADGNVAHAGREYYTPQVYLEGGQRLRWSWANSSNIGRLSKPFTIEDTNGDGVSGEGDEGYGYAGASWGIDPHALRPGGTDPSSLDDTYARDWLALLVLKTATTMDGISIAPFDHSRCVTWEGPDDDGRSRCTEMAPPEGGWLNDALHYGVALDDGQTYSYPLPLVTLGSTGLPDPDIPGGIVPLLAGSDRLAEPGWEDCVWPHSFVADQVPFPEAPWDYTTPSSVRGDSYRFGKDPDLDLRMVLATNIARHYCPEDTE